MSAAAGRSCRCGRCGAVYERTAFGNLTMLRTLTQNEISPHVVVRWPDGVVIDVRMCASCNTPIARLAS